MKHIKKRTNIDDPYVFLLISILNQAFSDLECLYQHKGTRTQRKHGRIAEMWLHDKDGTFPLIMSATDYIDKEYITAPGVKKMVNFTLRSLQKSANLTKGGIIHQ